MWVAARTSTLGLEVGALRRVSDGWSSHNTCWLGPEGLTQAPLLPSLLVSRRSLGSPGHAWDALRLSHPDWQGPLKPRHGYHPPEKGWVDPVQQALEPPGILGTPFSSPAQAPPLPRREKAAAGAQLADTGAWSGGREDRLLPFPLQVGPGASLPHSPVHHRALPLVEGEDTWGAGWGTVALTVPHIQLGPTRAHTSTGLAHRGVYTVGIPRWALVWAAAIPLH